MRLLRCAFVLAVGVAPGLAPSQVVRYQVVRYQAVRYQAVPSQPAPSQVVRSHALASQPATPQQALDAALRSTAAVAVVLDLASGRTLAIKEAAQAAGRRSSPGSILKPFFLAAGLRDGAVRPETTVFCTRSLQVGGHSLACTHPQTAIAFAADDALAYSCNTWFAQLARRMTTAQLASALRAYGLPWPPSGELSPEARELLVLGVEGIAVSPMQMALAYRGLSIGMATTPDSAMATTRRALLESVAYGMAHNAEVPGLGIAGKTGTANDPGQAWTHGWFCGMASGMVVVIYLPHGNGGDAAKLAHDFFAASGGKAAR